MTKSFGAHFQLERHNHLVIEVFDNVSRIGKIYKHLSDTIFLCALVPVGRQGVHKTPEGPTSGVLLFFRTAFEVAALSKSECNSGRSVVQLTLSLRSVSDMS
jgi:hypothetical protein